MLRSKHRGPPRARHATHRPHGAAKRASSANAAAMRWEMPSACSPSTRPAPLSMTLAAASADAKPLAAGAPAAAAASRAAAHPAKSPRPAARSTSQSPSECGSRLTTTKACRAGHVPGWRAGMGGSASAVRRGRRRAHLVPLRLLAAAQLLGLRRREAAACERRQRRRERGARRAASRRQGPAGGLTWRQGVGVQALCGDEHAEARVGRQAQRPRRRYHRGRGVQQPVGGEQGAQLVPQADAQAAEAGHERAHAGHPLGAEGPAAWAEGRERR
jgi:hypothetical protein